MKGERRKGGRGKRPDNRKEKEMGRREGREKRDGERKWGGRREYDDKGYLFSLK